MSGLFRNRKGHQHRTPTHTLGGKGRRIGGSRGQSEVLVLDRAADDGHAHTVVESSVRDSFTAGEAPKRSSPGSERVTTNPNH